MMVCLHILPITVMADVSSCSLSAERSCDNHRHSIVLSFQLVGWYSIQQLLFIFEVTACRPQVRSTMGSNNLTENIQEPDFDWLQLRKDINSSVFQETSKDRLLRKIKENPFVPVGCLITLGALSYGLWSFRQGQRKMSQYMMRLRIGAQGFTVVALIVGIGMSAIGPKE